jgi:hypothetical protein
LDQAVVAFAKTFATQEVSSSDGTRTILYYSFIQVINLAKLITFSRCTAAVIAASYKRHKAPTPSSAVSEAPHT